MNSEKHFLLQQFINYPSSKIKCLAFHTKLCRKQSTLLERLPLQMKIPPPLQLYMYIHDCVEWWWLTVLVCTYTQMNLCSKNKLASLVTLVFVHTLLHEPASNSHTALHCQHYSYVYWISTFDIYKIRGQVHVSTVHPILGRNKNFFLRY